MEKKDTFLKKNIYSINIILAFFLIFIAGFILGGLRTMAHVKQSMPYYKMQQTAPQQHKCKRCSKKASASGVKITQQGTKTLSEEEAKKEMQRIQAEMDRVQQEIMEQHKRFFNFR